MKIASRAGSASFIAVSSGSIIVGEIKNSAANDKRVTLPSALLQNTSAPSERRYSKIASRSALPLLALMVRPRYGHPLTTSSMLIQGDATSFLILGRSVLGP